MKPAKRQKVGHISEEDMSNLLHRYSAQKVLAMLQEVSQSADSKMDWNALVKKTATGITSAREYQLLWRHIAYCQELLETVDDGADALDDDSDLEYELEAYPAVSSEASAEAAACVKVLVGDSKVPNSSTVEAPLTINIPNGQSTKSPLPASIQGTNITVPVSVQKQPVLQGSVQKQLVPAVKIGEGSDANGLTSTTFPPRRKRKPWSEEEDLELIAAVEKSGGKNWANIVKGDSFRGERTAPQLSQRWAILSKRDSNRESNPTTGAQSNVSQPSSDQVLATNSALGMALKDNNFNKLTVGNGAATSSNHGAVNSSNQHNTAVNNTLSQPPQSQSNPAGGNPVSSKPGTSSSIPNPRAPQKKAPSNPVLNSGSSMVTKAAVAAGARIATPSEQLKVAQANNAVHIMPKGSSTLVKSSVTSTSNPTPPTLLGPNRTMPFGSQQVRANLVRPTTSSVPISHASGSQPLRGNFVRPVVLPAPSPKVSTSSALRNNIRAPLSQPSQGVTAIRSSSQTNVTVCQPTEVEVKKEEQIGELMKALPPRPLARPVPTQNMKAQQNPSPVSSSAELVASTQATATKNSQCSVNIGKEKAKIANSITPVVAHDSRDVLKNNKESLGGAKEGDVINVKQGEIASEKPNILPNSKASEKQKNLPTSKTGCDGKSEAKSETIG